MLQTFRTEAIFADDSSPFLAAKYITAVDGETLTAAKNTEHGFAGHERILTHLAMARLTPDWSGGLIFLILSHFNGRLWVLLACFLVGFEQLLQLLDSLA